MENINYIIFINKFINYNKIVPSTKIDSIIKAIINNFINKKDENNSYTIIIKYLNIIRIIYYLKRLKYYNNSLFLKHISKFFN